MIKKIISGGQTGVDQAALDTAIKLKIPFFPTDFPIFINVVLRHIGDVWSDFCFLIVQFGNNEFVEGENDYSKRNKDKEK